MKDMKNEYQYGVMSSKFSLVAENKLTAYATMLIHYQDTPHMIAIYFPQDSETKNDSWMDISGQISKRIDEIFGGDGGFEKYLQNNIELIRECYKSIQKLV